MGRKSSYSAEVRERAVRLVLEQKHDHESGKRAGLTTGERERLKELEREVTTTRSGGGSWTGRRC